MGAQKPGIPKGTRDFGPTTMAKRNFIFNTIRGVFEKFGFQPIETPSMENLSVLTGKYGDEGDQLIFKVLNSGDYLSKTTPEDIDKGSKHLSFKLSEKALRYDLTVPFARYVVMNRNEVTFPFKRYQIQPVWRADRPQKGRYREFFQCDADVVGTKSLLCEAEIILMINEVFQKLGINDFTIKINNRKILSAIAEKINAKDKQTDLFVAIDKLDKIGIDKVLIELESKGFKKSDLNELKSILEIKGSFDSVINTLDGFLGIIEEGEKGITELKEIAEFVQNYANDDSSFSMENFNVGLDVTLARGLSYYTGAIFEVKVNNANMGSVSGGGRYDDLTVLFGLPDVSGVGFSFGVDRLYDVMTELDLFPTSNLVSTQVLIANFDKDSEKHSLPLLTKLRSEGINSEIFPESTKLKKQMNYADNKNIPFVLLIGSDEIKSGKYTLKNMDSGEQYNETIDEVINRIKG